ncbi:SgcJ/EcaC family oxidoreductase [Amorphus sp. 3PC139-8]|uniref:YybH family protein n=1 Tax=Amorphus sp. 3PC139-8 TaxID=2735676 RepID=UPI00345C7943
MSGENDPLDVDEDAEADAAAIGSVLVAVATAFRTRDITPISDAYAADADWTNAFGTTLKGSVEILAYLDGLFRDPRFAAGRPKGPPTVDVRSVTADVAVARTYMEIEGQETTEGTIALRRNFSQKVLAREADGVWRIVSDIYMDARDETTYLGAPPET